MNTLEQYAIQMLAVNGLKAKIQAQLSEIEAEQAKADELKEILKKEVIEGGELTGFGYRAYSQVRKTVTYLPEKFVEKFPQMAPMVTETVVNKDKIKGLVKGGLLKEEQLADCQEVKETMAFYLEEVK